MANPAALTISHSSFSNWLSELPGDAERLLEESVTMAQPIQWATLVGECEKARGRMIDEMTT